MPAQRKTGLDALIELMMTPKAERERQVAQLYVGFVNGVRFTELLITKLAMMLPARETPTSAKEEAMRKEILADPLSRKNRRYSLSG